MADPDFKRREERQHGGRRAFMADPALRGERRDNNILRSYFKSLKTKHRENGHREKNLKED